MSARRCWAEIDLGALRHNLSVVRECLGPGAGVMAVVKANAYGHGVREVVRALRGVGMFGVANVREALEVREVDAETPVFILGPALSDEREEIVRAGFIPAVSSMEEALGYSALGGARIHLALDTGMGRIGIWEEAAVAAAREIAALPGIEIAGVASHLPVADEDESFTAEQLARFGRLAAELGAPVIHTLNSAGIIRFSSHAGTMARAGLMLYGSSPIPDFQKRLHPVLALMSRVTLVRELGAGRGVSYGRTFITPGPMRVATIALGYADGYPRHLSGAGADVLIGGRRCAVLGRVTMDQIMADVTALPEVAPGDEVVLIGRQDGEEILAGELAEKAGTIAWEIFTGIGSRVERSLRVDG